MINKFYNESCMETMKRMVDNSIKVDGVITSPFYNTNKKQGKGKTNQNTDAKSGYQHIRYDVHQDNMSNDEYIEFTLNLFDGYDKVLKENGVVLYNMSYGSENTTLMNLTIADIIRNTNFTLVDTIVWKKKSAMPNSCSPNKLTRIVEFIYVFVRKNEEKTFNSNKKNVSTRKSGQKMYENIFNYVEAKNNDGSNNLNKATFSSELCEKLIDIYFKEGDVIYDSFMGTGTTASGAVKKGLGYIGSEISEKQVEYSLNRLEKYKIDSR